MYNFTVLLLVYKTNKAEHMRFSKRNKRGKKKKPFN